MTRALPALLVAAALLAGCRDTAPAAGTPAPGSLSVTTGGYVGMAGGVVSQSR